MALTAANVRVAVTGGVYRAPAGSVLPTDATAALASPFTDGEVGYATDEGVTQSIESDTTDLQAWQNGETVRTIQTSHTLTYALSLMETNENTLETYYGNHTGTTSAGSVVINAEQGVRGAWVIQVLDGTHRIRICIPDGQVTERGETSFVNGEAIAYPITITCYPDNSGNKAYIYHADLGS